MRVPQSTTNIPATILIFTVFSLTPLSHNIGLHVAVKSFQNTPASVESFFEACQAFSPEFLAQWYALRETIYRKSIAALTGFEQDDVCAANPGGQLGRISMKERSANGQYETDCRDCRGLSGYRFSRIE
jgi:hypothetical protein